MFKKHLFFFVLIFTCTIHILAESKKIPFESSGFGIASKYERGIEAEKRAEEDALSKALKKTGVDVYYGFSDVLAQSGKKEYQMVSQYLWTFSRGVAIWERVGDPETKIYKDGNTACRIKIKGYIQLKGKPDPSFEILLEDESGPLGLSHTAYRHGEAVKVKFKLSHDANVYIFSIDEKQNAHLLFPNKILRNNSIIAGKSITFPPEDSGLSLLAYLPEGQGETIEMLQIVAIKDTKLLSLNSMVEKDVGPYKSLSAGTVKKVMSKLARLDRDKWTMLVLPYEIHK